MTQILADKLDAMIEEKLDSIISSKIDEAVQKIFVKLDEKDAEIAKLSRDNINLKRECQELSERVDELESDKLKNTLIISGEALPSGSNNEVTSLIVRDTLKQHIKYELPLDYISSAYRLGRRPPGQQQDNRSIAFKLSRDDLIPDIRSACRTIKPKKLYINENLTPARRRFLYVLRQLRIKFPDKLSACGSQSGRVFVWLKSPNPSGTDSKLFINKTDNLDRLCKQLTNLDSSEFIEAHTRKPLTQP